MERQYSKSAIDSVQAMSIKYNPILYDLRRMGKDVLILSLG
jgi:hypothetical protein